LDTSAAEKVRKDFIATDTNMLTMSEESRVEAFISGLRHHRSHFLITGPSTMEEVRQTVLHISKKKPLNTDSDSEEDDMDTIPDSSNAANQNHEKEGLIKTQAHSFPLTGETKDDFTSNPRRKHKSSEKKLSEIDTLINQFNSMKIMLMEAVTKVNKLEQASNEKFTTSTKSTDHLIAHISSTANSNIANITASDYTTEHVLLEEVPPTKTQIDGKINVEIISDKCSEIHKESKNDSFLITSSTTTETSDIPVVLLEQEGNTQDPDEIKSISVTNIQFDQGIDMPINYSLKGRKAQIEDLWARPIKNHKHDTLDTKNKIEHMLEAIVYYPLDLTRVFQSYFKSRLHDTRHCTTTLPPYRAN